MSGGADTPVELRLDPAVEIVDHGSWVALASPTARSVLRLTPAEADWVRCGAQGTDLGGDGSLLEDLGAEGFLLPDPSPAAQDAPRPRRRVQVTGHGLEVDGADRMLRAAHRHVLRHLFGRPVLLAMVAVAAGGTLALVWQLLEGRPATPEPLTPISAACLLLGLEVVAVIAHETAHGTVLVHHGRHLRRVGFGFYWGILTCYLDASEALLLPKRARIAQAAAGPFLDLVLAGALSLVALSVDGPGAAVLLFMAAYLWLDILVNLVPFLELDGYWLLADALDRPQLRTESRTAARSLVARQGRRFTWLGVYGATSTAFGLLLLVAGFAAWLALVGDLLAALTGKGMLGWLLLAPLALPTAAAWVSLLAQFAATRGARLWRT